jgi:hypothetical protein
MAAGIGGAFRSQPFVMPADGRPFAHEVVGQNDSGPAPRLRDLSMRDTEAMIRMLGGEHWLSVVLDLDALIRQVGDGISSTYLCTWRIGYAKG